MAVFFVKKNTAICLFVDIFVFIYNVGGGRWGTHTVGDSTISRPTTRPIVQAA